MVHNNELQEIREIPLRMRTMSYLKIIRKNSKWGKSSVFVECSKCGSQFNVYVWSFYGTGKKCPKCGTVYGGGDLRGESLKETHGAEKT